MDVPKLNELPPEILLIIFKNVSSKDLWRNVRNTCRLFRSLLFNSYLWVNKLQKLGVELEYTRNSDDNFRIIQNCVTLEKQRVFWNNERLKQFIKVTGHHATIDAIKFVPSTSGRRLCITGSRDHSLTLWDVDSIANRSNADTWELANCGSAHQGWIWSVSFATSDVFFSCGWDHRIKRWQLSGSKIYETHSIECSGTVLRVVCDGDEVLYSTYDRKVGLMDARAGLACVAEVGFHRNPVIDLAHSAGSSYVYSCAEDHRVFRIDKRVWKVVKTLVLPAYCRSLSICDENLLCGTADGNLLLLDAKNFSTRSEVSLSPLSKVVQVHLTPVSQICITRKRDIRLYTTGLRPHLFAESDAFDTELARFDFRNGDLAVTCGDGSIMFWLQEA